MKVYHPEEFKCKEKDNGVITVTYPQDIGQSAMHGIKPERKPSNCLTIK